MNGSVKYSRSVFKLLYGTTENKNYTIKRGMKKMDSKTKKIKK